MKKLVFILLGLIAVSTLLAQKGTIKGSVQDKTSGEKLFGANIVYEEGKGVAADMEGNFDLSLPAGTYRIAFWSLGYDTLYQKYKLAPGQVIEVTIELEETSQKLEGITISTEKYAQKIGETSVSVEVVKPQFIENRNDVSLDKTLNVVPGVSMIGEQVNIRGGAGYAAGAASRVMMLLDGLPILTADDANIEFGSLPMENVEQIEIIKGASSALYGSSAMNGIINMRTANPRQEPYTKAVLWYGFYENPFKGAKRELKWWDSRPMFGGATIAHRKRYNNFDLVLGGQYSQDRTWLYSNEQRRARFYAKTKFYPKKFNKKLSMGINTTIAIKEGGFFFIWKGWADSPDSLIGTPGYVPRDSLAYIPSEVGDFKTVPVAFDPHLTYIDSSGNIHSFKGRYYFTKHRNSSGENSNASLIYGEYSYATKIPRYAMKLVAGAAGSLSVIRAMDIFGNVKGRNAAVYTQINKKLFKRRVSFDFGVRVEFIKLDTADAVLQPIARAGLNWEILEDRTYFRASFGQGYRFPSIAERYTSTVRSGIRVIPNPEVEAEYGWSAEIGVKQVFNTKKWQSYFDLVGFVTQYNDMIEFVIPPDIAEFAYQANNVTDARISGVEVSAFGSGELFGLPTNVVIGYTYMVPIDLNWNPDNSTLPNSDLAFRFRHTAKADIQTTVKKIVIGLTGLYNSFMKNIDSPNAIPISSLNNIGDFRAANDGGDFVLDARVGYQFSDAAKVSFIAKNVFNAQYSLRPGFMEAPRNYTMQLAYEF